MSTSYPKSTLLQAAPISGATTVHLPLAKPGLTRNLAQYLLKVSLLLLLAVSGLKGWGQTTVFSDDFSTNNSATYTTSGAIGSSVWSVARSGNDWGARRNTSPAQLEMTNDVGATGNVAGWVYTSVPFSGNLSSPFTGTLANNVGLVTWTFNMRTNRSSALAGFGATTSYGMAFILATDGTSATTGNGYAVTVGDGANNAIGLYRYVNGLQGTRTAIIAPGNAPTNLTDYLSVRVTYNPTNNQWTLATRNDGTTSFADPSAGTLTQISTATVNSTHTSTALTTMGAYWQGSTGGTQTSFFDNVKVAVTPSNPTTTSISPTSVAAGSSSFTLTVNGTNFYTGLSSIYFNGVQKTTAFVSATQLTATISAAEVLSVANNIPVTVQTTGALAASGAQNFNVIAANAPTKLVITNVTPSTPSKNTSFSVTIQAQDASNNAQNVGGIGITVNLAKTTGTGSLGGTVSGTIAANANSITFTGLTYNVAETGVVLTASDGTTSLTAGTTTFNVLESATYLTMESVATVGSPATNLSSFTVTARRSNDNTVDLNYAGSITISKGSGPGAISGTLTKTPVNGVATFNDIQLSTAGAYTISAAAPSPSLTGVTSGTITINESLATYPFTSNLVATGVNANATASNVAPTVITGAISSGYYNTSATWGTLINTGQYLEFNLSPNSGYLLSVTTLNFNAVSTAAGATNFVIRSSIDNYASNLGTGEYTLVRGSFTPVAPTYAFSIALGAGSFSNLVTGVTFRIYPYGGGSTGNLRVDDLTYLGYLSLNTSPYLSTSVSSLADFGSVAVGSNSTGTSFNLSGGNLTSSPITVSAPSTDFQVSSDNSNFGATASITLTPPTLSSTSVYVRFIPQSGGAKSGSVTFSGGGVISNLPSVAVSGTGIGSITSSTSTLSLGTTVPFTTNTESSFTVSAANLSPASGNIAVSVAAPFTVSTSSTGGAAGSASVNLSYTLGTLNTTTVYVQYNPTATGASSQTLTISGGGATSATIAVSGTSVAGVFYSKGTGNLYSLATWGTNTDGTGTQPTSFTSGNATFNIANRTTTTIDATWTVSGTSSKVVVTNGVNFTVPSGFAFTGTTDVNGGGTITLQNITIPAFGTLAATSTVIFDGGSSQAVAAGTYGNLTIQNSGASKTLGGAIVLGASSTFTLAASTTFTAAGNTITLGTGGVANISGTIQTANVTTGTGGFSGNTSATFTSTNTPTINLLSGSTVEYNRAGAQTITSLAYYNLTVSNTTGTKTFAAGPSLQAGGTLLVNTGVTADMGSTQMSFAAGITCTVTINGTLNTQKVNGGLSGSSSSVFDNTNTPTITLGSASTIVYNGTGNQEITARQYSNLTISAARASNTITLNSGTIGVSGTFTYSATGTPIISTTGNTFDYTGSGSQTIAAFTYNNLSNTGGGARTLTGTINIAGTYSPTAGVITVGSSIVNFNGTDGQTIPAGSYFSITSTNNTRVLASSGSISIGGSFTAGNANYTVTGSTVTITGSAAQTINIPVVASGNNFNILTINRTGTTAGAAATLVAPTTTIRLGTLNVTAGYVILNATTTPETFVIGSLSQSGGTLDNNTSNGTGTISTLQVSGNYSQSSGIHTTSGSGSSVLQFNGGGSSTYTGNTTAANFIWTRIQISNNTTLTVLTNNMLVNFSPATTINAITIDAGSTLNLGTLQFVVSNANNIVLVNGTISTANANGISGSSTTAISNASSPAVTLNVGSTIEYSASGNQVVTSVGYSNLKISGSGIKTISGIPTIGGTTTVSAGELRYNPSSNYSPSSNVVLENGSTFSTTSITAPRTITNGTLNLNSGSATLALASGVNHTITFANSSSVNWAGTTLVITGWGGTAGQTNTNGGKINVGVGGLSSGQLSKISFTNYSGAAIILASGELVPAGPTITGAATAAAFTTTYGSASDAQTFAISGVNLTANLIATAPTGFEVSSNGTTYANTATFTQSSGAASGTLSVRLAATATVSGSYNSQNIVLSSTNATSVNIVTAASGNVVNARGLTITGLTGDNKAYNGTTAATASGTAAYSGLQNGETFSVSGTPTFTFASANFGTGISISTTGYTAPNSNYSVTQPTLSANITARGLTITGLTGDNKAYDGTAAATASGTAAYNGLQNGESFSVSGTPTFTFASANFGTGISISTTGYTAPNSNYSLTQPTLSANITARGLTITGLTGNNKAYDGTTAATASGTAAYSGLQNGESFSVSGTPTFTFASAGVANGISISTTGYTAPNSNYSLTQPTLSANITGIPPANANFRSAGDVNFNSASKWQYDQGGNNWVTAGVVPTSSNNVTISNGDSATLDVDFTVGAGKSLVLEATSKLVISPTSRLEMTDINSIINFGGESVTLKSTADGTGSIGKITGTLSGATNVTVERYIPAHTSRAWRLLSVPTRGAQTIRQAWQELGDGDLGNTNLNSGFGTLITTPYGSPTANGFDKASVANSLLKYDNVKWNGITSTFDTIGTRNTDIATSKAYFLYVRGDRTQGTTGSLTDVSPTTLRTKGELYQGAINSPKIKPDSFAVIGNIYPSRIDFTKLIRTGGVDNIYYIWDAKKIDGVNLGVYQTFSLTGSWTPTIEGGSFSTSSPYNNIEQGQAFFVHNNGAEGTVGFTEAAKVAGSSNNGFRPATPAASLVSFTSNLYTAGTSAYMADANKVVFDDQYSNVVDGHDALKMTNAGENFAISQQNKNLAIEGRQPITVKDTIFYNMWNLQKRNYQLELKSANLNAPGLTAILQDAHTGINTVLNLAISNKINFTVDATPSSSAANRFRVVFAQTSIAPLPVSFISVSASRSAAGNAITWKVAAESNMAQYEVERSADGRSFAKTGTVTASAQSTYSFTDAQALSGTVFYRIKGIGLAGEVKYSAIVKLTAGNIKPGFSVSPNPSEGNMVNLQFKNQAAGNYQISISTIIGQRLFTNVVAHPGGSSTQVLNITERLAAGTYQLEIIAPDKSRQTQSLVVKSND